MVNVWLSYEEGCCWVGRRGVLFNIKGEGIWIFFVYLQVEKYEYYSVTMRCNRL